MGYAHVKCGGVIDTKRRRCVKCGRRWNPISFVLTSKEIRLAPSRRPTVPDFVKPTPKPTTYARWADSIPGVSAIAKVLPNWPRWVRILVAIGVIVVVVTLIIVFT